jgi:hypothetical protein
MLLVYSIGNRALKHIYRIAHCTEDFNSSFEDLRVYGRKFKMFLKEISDIVLTKAWEEHELYSCGSGQGQVLGFCEFCNEPSDFIKRKRIW